MAHESFEDDVVAQLLNDNFICIKVDREERPDLDTIYMNYCQIMTGSGGWPLNLWLTPDQVPIYAGTYFPKMDNFGRTGFITILTHLKKMWLDDPSELMTKSQEIIAHVTRHGKIVPEELDQFITIQAIRDLKEGFDDVYGGFSKAPKFPSPHQLLFLMHDTMKHPNETTLAMVNKTLESMYAGGIYDHVGGGFARYSVDNKWLVPHFEKMLYDNALLLRAYNLAYSITQNPLYKNVAYDILRFLKREMLSSEGGFYTALDADSEGVEGKFYVFTDKEIDQVLGDEALVYKQRYDMTAKGNFEGKNIPNLIGKEVTSEGFEAFQEANSRLLKYRDQRVHPGRDHKVLTSVNGLLLTALSEMYRIYGDEAVKDLALGVATFIEAYTYKKKQLHGSYTQGKLGPKGVLEDYAFVMEGYIDLYQATFDEKYLKLALALLDEIDENFKDTKDGGYYMTSKVHESLIARPKECYDSAIPSGNSVMALNLLKLSRLTQRLDLQESYDHLIKAFGKKIKLGPSYFSYMMISLMYRQEGTKDLTIAFADGEEASYYSKAAQNNLNYFTVQSSGQRSEKPLIDHRTSYYVCEDFACRPPVHSLED